MPRFDPQLRTTLRRHVTGFERRPLTGEGTKSAAVALVVVPDEAGRAALVLTRRAAGLRRHSGQWALPGGRIDDGESVEEAARRELEEEVDLRLDPDDALGRLDDYATRSGFVISPVVLWGRRAKLRPDPEEVASVHLLPLAELDGEDVVVLHRIAESERPVLSLAVLDTLIFAPTAAVLLQFAEVAVAGRDTRVAHYEQPRFAWR